MARCPAWVCSSESIILPQKRGLTKDENRAGCTTP